MKFVFSNQDYLTSKSLLSYHIFMGIFTMWLSLEQLYLNKNNLNRIYYPDKNRMPEFLGGNELQKESLMPFENLCCLLLGNIFNLYVLCLLYFCCLVSVFVLLTYSLHVSGGNNIEDLASVDSLNTFPKLVVRLCCVNHYYSSKYG